MSGLSVNLDSQPLLLRFEAPLIASENPKLTQAQREGIVLRFQEISNISASRRAKVKIAAFVCTPVSLVATALHAIPGLCFCNAGQGFCTKCEKEGDDDQIPICEHTTCEINSDRPPWRAALPPIRDENVCELWPLVFDPCVFCVCCDKATPEVYLTAPEREERKRLSMALTKEISQNDAPLTQIMELTKKLDPEHKSIDLLLEEHISPPELRSIVQGYLYEPPSMDNRSESSREIIAPRNTGYNFDPLF